MIAGGAGLQPPAHAMPAAQGISPPPATPAQSHAQLSPVIRSLIAGLQSYMHSSDDSSPPRNTISSQPPASLCSQPSASMEAQQQGNRGGQPGDSGSGVEAGSGLAVPAQAPASSSGIHAGNGEWVLERSSEGEGAHFATSETLGAVLQGREGAPPASASGVSGAAAKGADSGGLGAAAAGPAGGSAAGAAAATKPGCENPVAAMLGLQNQLSLLVGRLQVSECRQLNVRIFPALLSDPGRRSDG